MPLWGRGDAENSEAYVEGENTLKGAAAAGMGRGSAYRALSLAFLAARLVFAGRWLVDAGADLKKGNIVQRENVQ